MAGPLEGALSILGGSQSANQAQDNSAAAARYLNDPKNRKEVLADAERIAAMRPNSQASSQDTSGPLSGALAILSGTSPQAKTAVAEKQPPQGVVAQTGQRIAESANATAKDIARGNLAAPGVGVLEGAANLATGLGSSAVGGLAGGARFLYNLASGEGLDKSAELASETIGKIQQAGTYQPRTNAGRLASEIVAAPATLLHEGGAQVGGTIGEAMGGEQGRLAGEAIGGFAPDAAGIILGGRAAMRSARPGVVTPEAAAQPASQAASAQAGAAPKPRLKLNVNGSVNEVPQPQGTSARPTAQPSAAPAPGEVMMSPEVGQLPRSEQMRRAQILQDIGLQDARKAVIQGDRKAGSTDVQTAKLDSPAGRLMDAKIAEERAALDTHADTLVRETGGTIGTDQSALFGRGNTIISPLDSLKNWFDERASALYRAADEQSQGVPTNLDRFKQILNDDSELTNSDRVHLKSALNSYGKKLGVIDDSGNIAGNAQQAETIRKFLGENWSPANSKMVSKLKDALDEDVMSAAGGDIYGQARQMWAMKKATLDNPNGIAKIMDSSGPEGINRAVAIEKIPDQISGMPVKQLTHIVDTLRNLPPELADQGAAALAEIKAQFANKVLDAGRSTKTIWNQKAVKNYLANNSERMKAVFTPEEMKRFETLRQAGDILITDQSYPGAAAQKHNLLRSGTMAAVKGVTTSAGSALGGPVGAAVGSLVGEKAAGVLGDAAALKNAQKRIVPISSVLNQ